MWYVVFCYLLVAWHVDNYDSRNIAAVGGVRYAVYRILRCPPPLDNGEKRGPQGRLWKAKKALAALPVLVSRQGYTF